MCALTAVRRIAKVGDRESNHSQVLQKKYIQTITLSNARTCIVLHLVYNLHTRNLILFLLES